MVCACVREVEGMAAGGWWVCCLVYEERGAASRGAVIGRKGRRIDGRIDRLVDNRFVEEDGLALDQRWELSTQNGRERGGDRVWLADERWFLGELEADVGLRCGAVEDRNDQWWW